jgi:hypothetical protein
MAQASEIERNERAYDESTAGTDWPDMFRLAAVVSMFAALAAMAMAGHISEAAIVITVIVLATMASWFHLEHAHRQPRPAHVRRHDPFRSH